MYLHSTSCLSVFFFFFNDTATTEIYTLSLHDALPISGQDPETVTGSVNVPIFQTSTYAQDGVGGMRGGHDYARTINPTRKIGRAHVLNSSHANISYAVFCLKKKKKKQKYNLSYVDKTQ